MRRETDLSRRARTRAFLVCALTLLVSLAVFDAVQVVDALHADASTFPARPIFVPKRPVSRVRPIVRARPVLRPRRVVKARPAFKPRPALNTRALVAPPTTAAPLNCDGIAASIRWPAGWRVQCSGPHTQLLGATEPTGLTVLYVRADETMDRLRIVALHEAGHAWDFARLDQPRIAQWCAARGCDAATFFSGGASGAGWSEPGGAEDWATVWDVCHGGEYHRSYLGLAPPVASQCALQESLVGYRA